MCVVDAGLLPGLNQEDEVVFLGHKKERQWKDWLYMDYRHYELVTGSTSVQGCL